MAEHQDAIEVNSAANFLNRHAINCYRFSLSPLPSARIQVALMKQCMRLSCKNVAMKCNGCGKKATLLPLKSSSLLAAQSFSVLFRHLLTPWPSTITPWIPQTTKYLIPLFIILMFISLYYEIYSYF